MFRIAIATTLLMAASTSFGAKTLADLPVSDAANRAYLTTMAERPWWNAAWSRRAPILVSSTDAQPNGGLLVDAIVDFGEQVRPEEVRLVTPWETEVPCIATAREGTQIELAFRVPFRSRENRPFFVYWGNPAATDPSYPDSGLALERRGDDLRLANGLVEIVFDDAHATGGLIKSIRLLSSQTIENQLLERFTGYAFNGFAVGGVKAADWSRAKIVEDNYFKKTVRYESKSVAVDFTLYASENRLDYRYTLKDRDQITLVTSWACGGGCADDDLVYPGASGEPLSFRASLDWVSDCLEGPGIELMNWISEGWYALNDRDLGDTVGQIFDRKSLILCNYWGHAHASGEQVTLKFKHRVAKGEQAVGSGALVATSAGVADVRREYDHLRNPPKIFVGAVEPRREIPVKIARLDRDWCADFNLGKGPGPGWCSGDPLPHGPWATNQAEKVRALGANVIRFGGFGTADLKIDRPLYDRIKALVATSTEKNAGSGLPEWGAPGAYDGVKFREMVDASHAKGLAVNIWGYFIGCWGWYLPWDAYWTDEARMLDQEVECIYADMGIDAVANARAQAEAPIMPTLLRNANGGNQFWNWKHPEDFFAFQRTNTLWVKEFYEHAKRRHPDKPVTMWNSADDEYAREMFLDDQAGCYDTVLVEMLPGGDFTHTKSCSRHLRALFDNEAGHTVCHHYYFFKPDSTHRISEIEMPFACGVNAFSHENLSYGNYKAEQNEIAADFFRFAEQTGLGPKAARMAPVKNLAVLRDSESFPYDVIGRNLDRPYAGRTRHDGRVQSFAEIRSFNADIVIRKYFTRDSLRKYRAVYVPEDAVFSDALAEELVAYVNAGGGAVVEGVTATNRVIAALGLRDGEVRTLGQGKIAWTKSILTDRLAARQAGAEKEARGLIAAVGGRDPFAVAGDRTLDATLQASDEGLFLAVFNRGDSADAGTVKISAETLAPFVAKGKPLYVLDVKRGESAPLATDGSFKIAAGGRQCGWYLIGDEKFAGVPAARDGAWCGAEIASSRPFGERMPNVKGDEGFRPAVGVEFLRAREGVADDIRRAREASIDVRRFVRSPAGASGATGYSRGAFAAALDQATYLHVEAPAEESDIIFRDQPDGLRDLLARGGTILFDRVMTGPEAKAFLESVNVFDPCGSAEWSCTDMDGIWNPAATNHPVFGIQHPALSGTGFARFTGTRRFAKWTDGAKDRAPATALVVTHDRQKAIVVAVENVLGKGRVVFNANMWSFNDWYEYKDYGNNLLSWIIGMPCREHVRRVERLHGGPGAPYGR